MASARFCTPPGFQQRTRVAFGLVAMVTLMAPNPAAAASGKAEVALVPIHCDDCGDKKLTAAVSEQLRQQLSEGGLRLLDDKALAARLPASETLAARCLDDDACLVKAAKQAEVTGLIAARARKAGKGIAVYVVVIDAKSGRRSAAVTLEVDSKAAASKAVASELATFGAVKPASDELGLELPLEDTPGDLALALPDLELPLEPATETPTETVAAAGDAVAPAAVETPPAAQETPAAKSPPADEAPTVVVSSNAPTRDSGKQPWVTYGGAAIAGAGAIVLGLGANAGLERNRKESAITDGTDQLEAARLAEEGSAAAARANILFISGTGLVVLGAGAIALDLLVLQSGGDSRVALLPYPGGFSFSYGASW